MQPGCAGRHAGDARPARFFGPQSPLVGQQSLTKQDAACECHKGRHGIHWLIPELALRGNRSLDNTRSGFSPTLHTVTSAQAFVGLKSDLRSLHVRQNPFARAPGIRHPAE